MQVTTTLPEPAEDELRLIRSSVQPAPSAVRRLAGTRRELSAAEREQFLG
jgi:hypothetical protein